MRFGCLICCWLFRLFWPTSASVVIIAFLCVNSCRNIVEVSVPGFIISFRATTHWVPSLRSACSVLTSCFKRDWSCFRLKHRDGCRYCRWCWSWAELRGHSWCFNSIFCCDWTLSTCWTLSLGAKLLNLARYAALSTVISQNYLQLCFWLLWSTLYWLYPEKACFNQPIKR